MKNTMKGSKAQKLPGAWIIPGLLALWAFVPEVRRLVDWQFGFNNLPVITLIPIVALAFLGLLVFRRRATPIPFGLGVIVAAWLIGFGFALLITFLSGGLLSGLYQAALFLAPMFVTLVVLARAEPAKTFSTVATTLAWLGFIVGAYGIYQYVSPPPWDALWAINSQLGSIGTPAPFELRVFSTLNSPGVCGDFLGLAFLAQLPYFRGRTILWRVLAVLFIVAGLLLTADRSAWVATAVGSIVFVIFSPRRTAAVISIAVVGIAATAFVAGAASSIPALQTIQDRVATLGSISSDDSVVSRAEQSRDALNVSLTEPLGQGLGFIGTSTKLTSSEEVSTLDNGYLSRFVEMGVFGFLAYLFATFGAALLTLLCAVQLRRESAEAAAVAAACLAVQVALLSLDLSSDHHASFAGTMFWIATAIPLLMSQRHAGRQVFPATAELQFAK